MSHGLSVAMSDTDLIVWATEASVEQDYLCARCGVNLHLDTLDNVFRHPRSEHCSEPQSLRKLALLYVQRLLECGKKLQLTKRCKGCHQEAYTEVILQDFDRFIVRSSASSPDHPSGIGPVSRRWVPPAEYKSKIITITADLDLLQCEGPVDMLIFMRCGSMCQRRFADLVGAFWLELDARNVVSGTDVALIESSLPACYFDCSCWRGAPGANNRNQQCNK